MYITGGVIATLGLIETNRKNSQDHIRQVHAARRDRYIEAVDKLSSENAPVRLGGVYALVGLVDEWLDDDNINENTRVKEGQIIVNNLCAYIRSPFPPAERIEEYEAYKELIELEANNHKTPAEYEIKRLQALYERFKEFTEYKKPDTLALDQTVAREEQEVRRAIFVEMNKRSSTISLDDNEEIIVTPGTWSSFDFDFSQAPIFYPLNNIIIEKAFFPSAVFYSVADFSMSSFIQDADFSETIFHQDADFTMSTFIQDANFREATFEQESSFVLTTFCQDYDFSDVLAIVYPNYFEANFRD